ncbi:unnamed protein product [Schistosoma guineensis]|nr:unnamed protein product [Schistosoma guineensis]
MLVLTNANVQWRYFVHLLLKLSIPVIVSHKTVLGIINTLICIGQFQAVPLYVNELCLPESKLIGNDSEDLAASFHVR